jgi:hypothetical protein
VLLSASLVAAAQGRFVDALTFRRDGARPALQAGQIDVSVWLSASPSLDPGRPSPRFADNLGTGQLAFAGRIQLPAAPALSDRNSAGWTGPDAVAVPFSAPFSYPGGTLCIQVDGSPVGAGSSWWPVDFAADGPAGSVTKLGGSCSDPFGRLRMPANADPQSLRPGTTARLLTIVEPDHFAIAMIDFALLPTPIDLAPFGAPGCALYVAPLFALPAAVTAPYGPSQPGAANLDLQLPDETTSLGACFFAQWIALGPSRFATTNAVKCQVATQVGGLLAAVVESHAVEPASPFPATGRILPHRTPLLRLLVR